jgi:rhodanese-related sulfurtransferase
MNSSTIKPEELQALLDKQEDIVILDVRRRQDYEADPCVIPGSEWHDPEDFDDWCETVVPAGKKTVVYCLKGGALSTMVTDFLRKRHVETCYLEGGITAWKKDKETDISSTCATRITK